MKRISRNGGGLDLVASGIGRRQLVTAEWWILHHDLLNLQGYVPWIETRHLEGALRSRRVFVPTGARVWLPSTRSSRRRRTMLTRYRVLKALRDIATFLAFVVMLVAAWMFVGIGMVLPLMILCGLPLSYADTVIRLMLVGSVVVASIWTLRDWRKRRRRRVPGTGACGPQVKDATSPRPGEGRQETDLR